MTIEKTSLLHPHGRTRGKIEGRRYKNKYHEAGNGQSEGGGKDPIIRANDGHGKRQTAEILELALAEVGCSPNPNPKLARGHSTLVHRTHGVAIGKGTAATHQPPSALSFGLVDTSRDNGIVRQYAPVCDPLNDEQRSNDLSNPSSHDTASPMIKLRESTNLSLREDR